MVKKPVTYIGLKLDIAQLKTQSIKGFISVLEKQCKFLASDVGMQITDKVCVWVPL